MPTHACAQPEREHDELVRRYSHLIVPQDLSKVTCLWPAWARGAAGSSPDAVGCRLVRLDRYVRVEHDMQIPPEAPASLPSEDAAAAGGPGAARVAWRAYVVPFQGVPEGAAREALAKSGTYEDRQHLNNALKFVACRVALEVDKRNVLCALGGAWDAALDGGEDPARCGAGRGG